jgi:hypothetical protein
MEGAAAVAVVRPVPLQFLVRQAQAATGKQTRTRERVSLALVVAVLGLMLGWLLVVAGLVVAVLDLTQLLEQQVALILVAVAVAVLYLPLAALAVPVLSLFVLHAP